MCDIHEILLKCDKAKTIVSVRGKASRELHKAISEIGNIPEAEACVRFTLAELSTIVNIMTTASIQYKQEAEKELKEIEAKVEEAHTAIKSIGGGLCEEE